MDKKAKAEAKREKREERKRRANDPAPPEPGLGVSATDAALDETPDQQANDSGQSV